MKKILFISIIILILTSCKEPKTYKNGDIVYLKPDSTIAVINSESGYHDYYWVLVPKNANPVFFVAETSIYGKKK